MKPTIERIKSTWTRRLLVPTLALATIISLATYEFAKPARASASPAPAASALDDSSVSALLSLDRAMEALAARVTPAVVNVTVTSRTDVKATDQDDEPDFEQFFGRQFRREFRMPQQQPRVEHGLGSGVIISPDGYIVTNQHVVDSAVDIRVTMSDRRILSAKLVGSDPLTDLAVIKVDGKDLPSVPFGDSTKLHPGQSVLAFGNPYGFRFTVTRGIVSALNRPNPSATDRRKPGEFIQTDAAINPGNSGGPLVNSRGEVVGINTFLISPSGSFSGIGFAIPTQIVKPTVDILIRDGKVKHGYMGIGISDVTPENSKFFHLDNAAGAIVTQVEPNSPGAKAGLKTGDVITAFNGKAISDSGELQVEVGQKEPGTTIHLQVTRDGKGITVPVTLEAMGSRDKSADASGSEHGKGRWGIGLADLSPGVRDQFQAPSEIHGAVVANVQPGSPADNAGLQKGDVIVEVNRQPVQSAFDAVQALGKINRGQDALVLVWSKGGNTFQVLHPSRR
jgi:serine protease Do